MGMQANTYHKTYANGQPTGKPQALFKRLKHGAVGNLAPVAPIQRRESMSTRCQIKITYLKREVLLYHHWDGYPEGVGLDLIKRQKQLKTWDGNIIVNELINNKHKDDGYEIAYQVHTDIDYWYEIDCNRKTIRCWKVKGYNLSDHAEVIKGEEFILHID